MTLGGMQHIHLFVFTNHENNLFQKLFKCHAVLNALSISHVHFDTHVRFSAPIFWSCMHTVYWVKCLHAHDFHLVSFLVKTFCSLPAFINESIGAFITLTIEMILQLLKRPDFSVRFVRFEEKLSKYESMKITGRNCIVSAQKKRKFHSSISVSRNRQRGYKILNTTVNMIELFILHFE